MKERCGFTQVLVTRYSVRLDGKSVIRGRGKEWLFSDSRMSRRLVLFSNLTFPSIVKSSVTPDLYVVVIDKELPGRYREQLELLMKPYPWAIIHEWQSEDDWFKLEWVLRLMQDSAPNILIGQIDDDDALQLGANERLRSAAQSCLAGGRHSLWTWFGSNNAWEWDLDTAHEGVGFLKPYSGGTTYWQGVGTSVLVPNDPQSPTSYVWPHSVLEMVFEPFWKWHRTQFSRVLRMRLGLLKRLVINGHIRHIPSLLVKGWLVDVGTQFPSDVDMLISNSGTNLQTDRIERGRKARWSNGVIAELERFGVTEESAVAIGKVIRSAEVEEKNY